MKINISPRIWFYLLLVFIGSSSITFTFFLPSPQGFYAAIIAAAAAGLGVAVNIYRTKQLGKHLVCPTGSNCNVVVNSRYAAFFGISLEYWGMAYYTVIILSYAGLLLIPELFSPMMMLGVVALSVLAGLFSLYLLFVQAVLLREWCIWCILSALLSLAICMFSLVSAEVMIDFLAQYSDVLWVIRSFGLTLGVGGITAAVLLFFQSLADRSVDEKELSNIKGVFELVWIGLGLVIIGQFGLFVAYPAAFASSAVFLVQSIALITAIIAGAMLMVVYTPFLIYVPFGAESGDTKASFSTLRRPILAIGAVALAAWYFIFFTGFIASTSVLLLLALFLCVVSLAAFSALAWDVYLTTSLGRDAE